MVNYKSSTYVSSCLASLDPEPVEQIIIVENGSGEDEWLRLQEAVRGHASKVRLVRSHVNLGFGAGVNFASSYVNPDYAGLLWILNPDTTVTKGCVTSLANRVVNGELDVVSPAIVTGPRTAPSVWFAGGVMDLAAGATRHMGYGGPLPSVAGIISSTFITGAAPMISFEAWKKLDGFNESLFLYWEDADLSLRARNLGLSMGVDLDSLIWHEEGGSGEDEGRSALYYFYMQKNRLIVSSPYSGLWSLLMGKGAKETGRLLLRPLREKQGRARKALASIRGLAAGIYAVRKQKVQDETMALIGEK